MSTNNTNTIPSPAVHVKVSFNEEYRRFTLETISYNSLERTLRTLYSLEDVPIKVTFMDDEEDWVLISTDEELKYATELAGSPLRLSFTASSTESSTCVTSKTPVSGRGRGCGRGRGRGGRGGLLRQERLVAKAARLTERVQEIEKALEDPELNSERNRVLRWKLSKLQNKLARVQEKKACIASLMEGRETPEDAYPSEHHHPRGRGRDHPRGGRGGRGGRQWKKNFDKDLELENQGCDFRSGSNEADKRRESFLRFRQCKAELKAARKSGDLQAIETCKQALAEAKKNFPLAAQRANKRECFLNLKAAQAAGDEEQIRVCQEALAKAVVNLKQAKADFRGQKF